MRGVELTLHCCSRASAVVVAATPEFAAQAGNPKVHVLSSQHVTCPYNFPRYYPPEEFGWLQAVDESHISVEVEARSDDGTILQEAKCATRMFPHTHRYVWPTMHAVRARHWL